MLSVDCNSVRAGSHLPRRAVAIAAAVAGITAAQPALAFRFSMENGVEGNFDSVLSYGMQVRARSRDCRFVGYDNGGCANYQLDADAGFLNSDDGNLNYNRGDVFSAAVRGVHDLYLRAPGGWSGFLRGSWFYDIKVTDTRRTDIPDGGRNTAVRDAEILDAYVQKNFDLAGRPSKLRVGKQVLTWGESILTFGGIGDINPLDFRKAFSAGVQLKELFRPTPMIDFSTSVTDDFSVETYYQFDFKPHVLPASGTFFSPFDFGTPGGRALVLGTPSLDVLLNGTGTAPTLPRGTLGDAGTINAATGLPFTEAELQNSLGGGAAGGTILYRGDDLKKRNGQYGLAGRYTFESSGDELGLYYIRYHEKTPALAWRTGGGTANFALGYSQYQMNFVPDRDLFGISYNTKLSDWSIGTELSYRPNQAVIIDQSVPLPGTPYACDAASLPDGTVCPGFIETKRWQFTINGLSILKPQSFGGLIGALGATEGLMIAEFTVSHLPSLDLTPQPGGAHGTNSSVTTVVPYLINYDFAKPTKTTSGFSLVTSVTYPNIFGTRASLSPEIGWNHGLSGTPATFFPGYGKGVGSATFALNFDFKTKPATTARLDYTHFYGGGQGNPMLDKDYFGLSFVTSF